MPTQMSPEDVRATVRDRYAERATSCCGPDPARHAREIGYDEAALTAVPAEANLGLGCGNPIGLAGLQPGEIVLDLGSGAGFDALLAAQAVGPTGRVIGVDMTPEMVAKARANARAAGVDHVEFHEGAIEALPLPDASVDVVISNCVVNLSPEKPRVFAEAFRVLRPGGRLLVSDIVLRRPLPEVVRQSVDAWVGCIAGAALRDEYLAAIRAAGFVDVRVERDTDASALLGAVDPSDPLLAAVIEAAGGLQQACALAADVASVAVAARKPQATAS